MVGVVGKKDVQVQVDLEQWPNAKKLVETCQQFFAEIEDLTPSKDLEVFLNKNYGPGNPLYEDMCKYVKIGLDEGWCANIDMDGPKYRRSKIRFPSEDTRWLSITTVYMESEEEYSGQYHRHPYGEINCVVQLDKTAELRGLQGWQGAGWTSPDPGSHHYPQVRGGALVALFFLPSGRISYDANPSKPQPYYV